MSDARRRRYRSGDITAATSLAQGRCYAPNCPEPLFKVIDGQRVTNFEIAHSYALNPGGPRWDDAHSDPAWLNSYENWLLLCTGHHRLVDRVAPEKYSVEALQKWRADRALPGLAALLPAGLTEDRLEAVLTEALAKQQSRLEEALSRLGQIDPEAARLLRDTVEAADALASTLSGDTVETLGMASFELRGLMDSSDMLLAAADKLQHLPESATMLANAADSLSGLSDDATLIYDAAEKLQNARGEW
jgi:hypothetical protein